jgi:hypothetical protein
LWVTVLFHLRIYLGEMPFLLDLSLANHFKATVEYKIWKIFGYWEGWKISHVWKSQEATNLFSKTTICEPRGFSKLFPCHIKVHGFVLFVYHHHFWKLLLFFLKTNKQGSNDEARIVNGLIDIYTELQQESLAQQ